jgi:glutamate 5-kinase
VTGQILLTPNITEERRYFLNARTTISTLLGLGAIPIINENDSRRHRRDPLWRQ